MRLGEERESKVVVMFYPCSRMFISALASLSPSSAPLETAAPTPPTI